MNLSLRFETYEPCDWCDEERVHPYDYYHKSGECLTRGFVYDDAVVCFECGAERGYDWIERVTRTTHPEGFTCADCGAVSEPV